MEIENGHPRGGGAVGKAGSIVSSGGGFRLFRTGSVAQSLGVYLPTTAAHRLIGLARGIILTWLMAAREFGLFQISVLTIGVLIPLCSVGLNEAVARYVPQYETRRSLRPFLARVVPFVLIVGAVTSAAVLLAAAPVGRIFLATFGNGAGADAMASGRSVLMRLAAGATFTLIAHFLVMAILRGLRMFMAVSLIELAGNVAFTALAIGVALGGWATAETMISCYVTAYVLLVLVFTVPLWRMIHRLADQSTPLPAEGNRSAEGSLFDQMLRFSIWSALAATLWQSLQYYPMWYLQKVRGPEVTAVFAGVCLMTQAVLVGAVAVVTVVQASVTKTWESQGMAAADRQLRLAFKSTALLMLGGCTAVALAAPWIIRLLPPGYRDGAAIIPISLMFFLVGGQLAFQAIHFNLIEKTRYLFMAWLIGLTGNVVFGVWLIRPGLEAAAVLRATAWAGTLGISMALAATLVFVRRVHRPLDLGSWLLILATFALALPAYGLLVVISALLVVAAMTDVVLGADEKRRLGDYVRTAVAVVRRERHA